MRPAGGNAACLDRVADRDAKVSDPRRGEPPSRRLAGVADRRLVGADWVGKRALPQPQSPARARVRPKRSGHRPLLIRDSRDRAA
jgi:hypothetical protein